MWRGHTRELQLLMSQSCLLLIAPVILQKTFSLCQFSPLIQSLSSVMKLFMANKSDVIYEPPFASVGWQSKNIETYSFNSITRVYRNGSEED